MPADDFAKLIHIPPHLKDKLDKELSSNGNKYRAATGQISANVLIIRAIDIYLSEQDQPEQTQTA